jgi:poly [ADP-ribose] polymerase
MTVKTQKSPLLKEGEYTVDKVMSLNFFDLTGEKAHCKGTSNKTYTLEINVSKNSNKAQIYSLWGATGGTLNKDWRYYDSLEDARKDFDKIVKSKKKKGYTEIDVAQRVYGSEEAKKITKAVTLTNVDTLIKPVSSLHTKVQYLITELFGSVNATISSILRCPLGQLTNAQVQKGRDLLVEAQSILDNNKKLSTKNISELERITNDFYASIPHNLGTGARGQLTHLLLDDAMKVAQKEADLDTLLDGKSVGAVLKAGSFIDDQYKTLNADIEYIDESLPLFKWINDLVLKTRASNHHYLGKIKVLNVWSIKRHGHTETFLDMAKDISKACKGQVIPDMYSRLGVNDRGDAYDNGLYKRANVLPLFHGTRTQNLVGITKAGLLIRPHNAVLTGAMYGNGVYTSSNSSKSINYTNIKTSYWANGSDDKAFLFIADTILGNQKIVNSSGAYGKNSIKPNHSVWAKGGYSGVINDEMVIYDTGQINLRYLVEFTCRN